MTIHPPTGHVADAPDGSTYPLILDLLAWLEREPRLYADVMDRWRTSCPRLTVWEDAVDGGFVERVQAPGAAAVVRLTERGVRSLRQAERIAS